MEKSLFVEDKKSKFDLTKLLATLTMYIMIFILGFTLGFINADGDEMCQNMIKIYGCELKGASMVEANELAKQNISDCSLVCNIENNINNSNYIELNISKWGDLNVKG